MTASIQSVLAEGLVPENPATRPSSELYACSDCRDSGWLLDPDERAAPCPCRRRRCLEQRLERIDIQFREARFETFEPRNRKQEEVLRRMTSAPEGNYYLCGDYGVGKTHLLVAQYRVLCLDQPCEFRSTHSLMEELRAAEFKEESPLFQRITDRIHLFWDDIDKLRTTDFRREMIFHLVDLLYRRQMGISVTSNLTLTQLVENDIFPSGVVRRLDDMCTVLSL